MNGNVITTTSAAAPISVRSWLTQAPDGELPILHRSQHAIYLDLGSSALPRVVGVTGPDAVALPLALQVQRADLSLLAPTHAQLRSGNVHLIGPDECTAIVPTRVVDMAVGALPDPTSAIPDAPAPPLLVDLPDPEPENLQQILGLGPGLTPLGDDFLAGWIGWRHAAGLDVDSIAVALLETWRHTTTLSAALLLEAVAGRAIGQFRHLLASLGTEAAEDAVRTLLAVGATSGAGLLYGAQRARAAHCESLARGSSRC